jgi:acetoin utilization deacetylase AcuC-like enzyme
MFIYNPQTSKNLADFGIDIPLQENRYQLVLNEIKFLFHKSLIIDSNFQSILPEDLLLAHKKKFMEEVMNNPEHSLMETYELLDGQGLFHRFHPEKASRPLKDLLIPIEAHLSGTLKAAQVALEKKFAFHVGGGLHHAMSDRPRGFCLFNDLIIAARKIQHSYLTSNKNIWIIDVDAHKGDGSAEITHGDPSIVTLSIHMKNGWPLNEGVPSDPWFLSSNIDIPIAADENHLYLEKLWTGLIDLKANFATPALALVVLGSDVYEKDLLPSTKDLSLSLEEVFKRDKMIFDFLKEQDIPQAYVMAGGYGPHSHEPYFKFLHYIKENLFNHFI